jgi:hypothetical protein
VLLVKNVRNFHLNSSQALLARLQLFAYLHDIGFEIQHGIRHDNEITINMILDIAITMESDMESDMGSDMTSKMTSNMTTDT